LPYELKAHSTEIWGRGTVDAKACVAAQTIAVVDLLKSSSRQIQPGSLALLFVVGEETGGDGMRYFSEHKPTNYSAVIFGEPTEGNLASGHKGFLAFKLHIRGKAAHSGYPWLGVNANSVMVEALSKLLDLERTLPSSGKFGSTTLNIGFVKGGVAANVVAEVAEASVAIRIAAGTPDKIKSMVTDALASTKKAVEHRGGHFDIEFLGRPYGPVNIDADVKGFNSITVNYGTDIPNLDGDHKRYLYGPGSILVAHSDHEHLKVSELQQAVKDYRRLILAALESR
jgi:acetylornithine deacetylase